MTKNTDIINTAIELIIKAAILAARFSGRARKRSLKRLSKMDVDEKDKEIIFLRDKANQSATTTDYNPSKRAPKETDKQAIHASREDVHPLLHGNLSGSKTQSNRISGHCQINALPVAP